MVVSQYFPGSILSSQLKTLSETLGAKTNPKDVNAVYDNSHPNKDSVGLAWD